MKSIILEYLHLIEKDEDIVICHAVESGSRAWGFPSRDSDYDIRFLYVHRPEWYLSIDLERKRDVIDFFVRDKELDFVGWDIRKALKLFMKSNPPLLEHLQSPIVYLEKYSLAPRMREFLPELFSPRAGYYHYLHMARGNYSEYLTGDTVLLKKYLYVLRPLMAVRWVKKGLGPVPVEFEKLVEAVIDDDALKYEIGELIARKRMNSELGSEPRIPVLHDFIERELSNYEDDCDPGKPSGLPVEKMNSLFRDVLEEVWANDHDS